MRFSEIMVTYFMLGACMWGAGFISYGDAGPAQEFIEDPVESSVNNEVVDELNNMSGPVGNVVGTLGGGLVAVWDLLSGFVDLVFWPYTTLNANGAPPEVTLVLGGGTSVAFVGGIIRTVRGTA